MLVKSNADWQRKGRRTPSYISLDQLAERHLATGTLQSCINCVVISTQFSALQIMIFGFTVFTLCKPILEKNTITTKDKLLGKVSPITEADNDLSQGVCATRQVYWTDVDQEKYAIQDTTSVSTSNL